MPLLRAAMAGEIRFVMVCPAGRIPLRILDMERDRKPLLVGLNGDGGGPATPDAFPQAQRLMRWARCIVLHGAGGEAVHYQCAVEAARVVGRVLIAETTATVLPDWVALKAQIVPKTPGLVIAARDGLHPVETVPAGTVVQ